jgi:hypothetical protein
VKKNIFTPLKNSGTLLAILFLASCSNSIKLAIPETFKQQATMLHVSGARSKKMSFESFTTSKIKRGIHVSYPGWGQGFFLENILLQQVGIQKTEVIRKEKDKFRYSLSDGKNSIHIYGQEKEVTSKLNYKIGDGTGILGNYERLQRYQYIFSAMISTDTTPGAKSWELMMTNIYDRKTAQDKKLFTIIKPDDNGLATNGVDTIFIKGITIKKTELSNGRTGELPIKLLGGYELSTSAGVIAIIDAIDRNIWFYNELDATERLTIAGITTAIFARRVNDVKW